MTIHSANKTSLRQTIDFCKEVGVHDVGIEELCFLDASATVFRAEDGCEADAIIDAWRYGREVGVSVRGSWTGFRSLRGFNGSINYCSGNGEEICVDSEGRVFPCYAIPLAIGSIDRLDECFVHPVYQAMTARVVGNIAACHGCELEGPCGGGCAADAYAQTGSLSEIDPEKCSMRRKISRHLLGAWAIKGANV